MSTTDDTWTQIFQNVCDDLNERLKALRWEPHLKQWVPDWEVRLEAIEDLMVLNGIIPPTARPSIAQQPTGRGLDQGASRSSSPTGRRFVRISGV